MPHQHVYALRRLLLVSCVSLALSTAVSGSTVNLQASSARVGGRLDGIASSTRSIHPARKHLHPSETTVVANCEDSGAGSLRDAIAAAADGDTIDLTQLTCSPITLTTGELTILQESLSVEGPGPALVIKQGTESTVGRIMGHVGSGTLTLSGLGLRNGYFNYDGGCIYSEGNLTLTNVSLSGCQSGMDFVSTYDHDNRGGAVYVAGNLTMSRSTVEASICYSRNGRGFGGGLFVGGSADISESTISGNQAGSLFGDLGNVGGITIAGTEPSVIVNSTISGNLALDVLGGVYVYAGLTLSNSTIAFNSAVNGLTTPREPAGLQVYYGPLTMDSTIIANNYAAGSDYDLYAFGVVGGTNNLVISSSNSPPGTLTADPNLQALDFNGGPTKTHALLATSVAINSGNNAVAASTDQRGAGFARVSGNRADIGAFEFQVAPPLTYTIGGNVGGLSGGGLILQQSGGDNLQISANGSFTFATPVNDATPYDVTVLAQPTLPNQTCVVANGEGVISGANVTDVNVTCTTIDYTVGGSVSGLVGSGLVLQQSGGDDLPIVADGGFTFATPVPDGSAFSVRVSEQPNDPPGTCVVVNGAGTVSGVDITDVTVTCSTEIDDRIFADGFEVHG